MQMIRCCWHTHNGCSAGLHWYVWCMLPTTTVYNTIKTVEMTNHTSALLIRCALMFVVRFTYLGHSINQEITYDNDIQKQMFKLTITSNVWPRRFSLCGQAGIIQEPPLLFTLQLTVVIVKGGLPEQTKGSLQ